MPPGGPDPEAELGAIEADHDVAAVRIEPGILEADGGAGGTAEADHVLATGGFGDLDELRRVRVVEVQDRHAARLQAAEDLALGGRDRLDRGEEAEMGGRDPGDHGDLRPDQAGERRDLAGRVHAELVDAVDRVARRARERERHAPVIVVAGGARMGRRLTLRTSESASLVPVLPTLPVIAAIRAWLRTRAARPSAVSAAMVSSTRTSLASAGMPAGT